MPSSTVFSIGEKEKFQSIEDVLDDLDDHTTHITLHFDGAITETLTIESSETTRTIALIGQDEPFSQWATTDESPVITIDQPDSSDPLTLYLDNFYITTTQTPGIVVNGQGSTVYLDDSIIRTREAGIRTGESENGSEPTLNIRNTIIESSDGSAIHIRRTSELILINATLITQRDDRHAIDCGDNTTSTFNANSSIFLNTGHNGAPAIEYSDDGNNGNDCLTTLERFIFRHNYIAPVVAPTWQGWTSGNNEVHQMIPANSNEWFENSDLHLTPTGATVFDDIATTNGSPTPPNVNLAYPYLDIDGDERSEVLTLAGTGFAGADVPTPP